MYGVIYKITNIANGKIYIGKTTQPLLKRFAQHLRSPFKPNHGHLNKLHLAIMKYGVDNFKIEQIDEATSLEELNQKEIYWIATLNSRDKNIGYNINEGGDGNDTTGNYRWYTNGKVELYLSKDEFPPEGFYSGRSTSNWEDRHGKVWINNGVIQKHVPKSERHLYSNNWMDGMLDRGDKWREHVRETHKNVSQESIEKQKQTKRNKSTEEIQAWKNKISKSLMGHTPLNKGKISITNGVKNKYITSDELEEWINKGWKRGNHQNRKK